MNKPVLPPSRFAPTAQPAGRDTPTILSAGDARSLLVAQLAALRVPRFLGSADGRDIRDLRDHAIEAIGIFDAWIASIGEIVKSNSPHSVNTELFERPFLTAIEGNALHQMDVTADELDEDNGQFGVGA